MAREAIMKMMACNIGWCKEYEGDDVHGDHGFIYLTDPHTQRVRRNYKSLYMRLSRLIRQGVTIPKSRAATQRSPISIDPEHRKAVEDTSMSFVRKHLRRRGFKVKNVSREN